MGSHVEKGDFFNSSCIFFMNGELISELPTIAEHTCMGETGGVDGLSNQMHEPTSNNVWPPLLASPVLEGLTALFFFCYFWQTFLPSRHFFPNCSFFCV